MQNTYQLNRKDSKRRSLLLSILFHVILFLLLLMPCLSYLDKPEHEPGVTVMMNEFIPAPTITDNSSPRKDPKPKKAAPAAAIGTLEPDNASKAKTQEVRQKTIATKTQEISPVVNGSDNKSENELQEARKREEAARKAQAEAERQRKKEEAKSRFGALFADGDNSKSSDDASLTTPDASALENITEGYSRVGDGLGERQITYQPTIKDDSQKTGKVVVKICVDSNGSVVSSRYTQRGSTTTDPYLIELAEKNARKYRFSKSEIAEQCGQIVIDFRLR